MRDELAARFDELDQLTVDAVEAVNGLHIDTHHHPRSADPAIYADDRIHCNARGHAIAFAALVTRTGRLGTLVAGLLAARRSREPSAVTSMTCPRSGGPCDSR